MENVMNKLSKTAMQTYRNAAEATNRITREIKLKVNMADNKSQINDLYEKIGKKVYEKYLLKENIDMQKDFDNDCSMIDVLANEVEDYRMQLLNLKDLKQCKNCHSEIDLEFRYCPNCGFEQQETEETMKSTAKPTLETTDTEDSLLTNSYNKNNENNENNENNANNANNNVEN